MERVADFSKRATIETSACCLIRKIQYRPRGPLIRASRGGHAEIMTFRLRAPLRLLAALPGCVAAGALVGCTGVEPPAGEGGSAGQAMPAGTGNSGAGRGGAGSGGAAGSAGGNMSAGGVTSAGGVMNTGGMVSAGGARGGGAGTTGGTLGSGGLSGAAGAPGGAGGTGGRLGSGGTATGGLAGTGGDAGGSAGRGGGGAGGGAAGSPAVVCPSAQPLTGGQQYCSNSKGNVAGGGYSYELWAEGAGSGCMTVYGVDANFKANWTGVEDFLARIGLNFDQTKTHTQIGTLSADFAETKTGGDGLVYVGIYGWTVSPLREYYILDDWGDVKPAGTASDGTPRTSVGTLEADGETYDVWMKTRTNKPAITGDNMTFDQYFSIRRTARQCGHISISKHFTEWEALGLSLGKLYEAKILVESQDSTGTVDFTTAKVEID